MNNKDPDGFSGLESINDDCLRYICQFLNIIDIVNLAATSQRLLYFAEACVFQKKAKTICIKMEMDRRRRPAATLDVPSDRTYSSLLKLENFETALSYVGEFVDNLKIVFIYLFALSVALESKTKNVA